MLGGFVRTSVGGVGERGSRERVDLIYERSEKPLNMPALPGAPDAPEFHLDSVPLARHLESFAMKLAPVVAVNLAHQSVHRPGRIDAHFAEPQIFRQIGRAHV